MRLLYVSHGGGIKWDVLEDTARSIDTAFDALERALRDEPCKRRVGGPEDECIAHGAPEGESCGRCAALALAEGVRG